MPKWKRKRDPLDRLMEKASAGPGECWTVAKVTRDGYAVLSVEARSVYGHRYAYERLRDDIPDGLVIDHLCRNRACINPWHMEPVPQRINILRGERSNRKAAA